MHPSKDMIPPNIPATYVTHVTDVTYIWHILYFHPWIRSIGVFVSTGSAAKDSAGSVEWD